MNGVCPSCGSKVVLNGAVWGRCVVCRSMVFRETSGPAVVVAHELERVVAHVGVVAGGLGLHVLHAPSGSSAWRLLEAKRPVAAVLDVALPEVMSFQLIERLRARPELAGMKIVLIASVFNRTAYKRRPSSLYGADDYIEQHHVHDLLPQKLRVLLRLPEGSWRADELDALSADERTDLIGCERVAALARSIAADIALYHAAEMSHAVQGEMTPALERALEEGKVLLVDMVGPRALCTEDPVREAFRSLVVELRGEKT